MEFCLEDLLNGVENDERILQFRFQYKNTLVWPFIRFSVFTAITFKVYNINEMKMARSQQSNLKKYIKELFKCMKICLNTPFLWKQKDLLYFYNAVGNVATSDGTIYNRIYDWFVMEYNEQSGVIETLGQTNYKKDTHVDKRYLDPINFFIEVLCYFTKADSKDIHMADDLMDYLCNDCRLNLLPHEIARIKKNILFLSKKIKYTDKIFLLLFHKIDPKLVFIECGCLGGDAYLIKLLHEMGIKTAEVQHGWVGANHEAYNQSEFLCNNTEYAEYMPDYFLGWSEYWLEKISVTGMRIPIGNPQFWQQYLNMLTEQKNGKTEKVDYRTVLWIAFTNNEVNIKLLNQFILASNNEYYIRIRLHPLEKFLISEYKEFDKNEKVTMDELPTIYDSFQVSDYVIAESSTVIYEALAVGKPTFIYDNEVADWFETGNLTVSFKNIDELLDLLQKAGDVKNNNADYQKEFFGEAWQDKFKAFIEGVI